jgi:predicted transcriptional regulator
VGRKKGVASLTPLELELMKVLWRTGPATVQQVREQLGSGLAYTTVQTMLNVLHRKGKVTRSLRDRSYTYRPSVEQQREVGELLRDVVERAFGGSAEDLVLNLMQTRQLTPERLERLASSLEKLDDER